MKKIIFLLLALYINIKANKDMIILIDEYETFENAYKNSEICLEAIGIKYLSALDQEFCPVIASKSLCAVILKFKYFFEDVLNLDLNDLHFKYSNLDKFKDINFLKFFKEISLLIYDLYSYLNSQIKINNINKNNESLILGIVKNKTDLTGHILNKLNSYFNSDINSISFFMTDILNYILCYSIAYENWIIKDINKDFCLLMPKKYLDKFSIDYNSIKYNKNLKNNLTKAELKLGLKVNHLKDLVLSCHLNHDKIFQKSFLKALDNIFIKDKKSKDSWSFYCSGHGFCRYTQTLTQIKNLKNYYIENKFDLENLNSKIGYVDYFYKHNKNIEDKIIGLSKKDFRRFLIFLNNKINTNILYYSTCFSGGINLIEPYKNLILNYDVIAESLTEACTYQDCLYLNIPYFFEPENNKSNYIDFNKKKLKLDTNLNFKKFFKKSRANQVSLKDKIYYINNYFELKNGSYYLEKVNNMPSIRYKNSDKFKIIIGFDNVKIIDKSIFKDLNLNNTKLALIYNDYINNKLILSQDLQAIVSMTKKNRHVFENIQAKDLTLIEVINKFLFAQELAYPKFFWIKKLKCKDYNKIKNLVITNNILTYDKIENLLDYQILTCNSIYFQDSLNKYNLTLVKDLKLRAKNLNLDIKKIDFDYQKEVLKFEPNLKIYL